MSLNQEEKWLLSEKYAGVKSEDFHSDLERLRAGEPLAYVIGQTPFLGCRIFLDSYPLIPRSETEYWVEKVIAEINKKDSDVHVLDLCAGSGCIGVAVAKHCPFAKVTFAEIESSHLDTIQKNLNLNLPQVKERFEITQSDLFENISGQFDFILSNPPYIDPALDRTEVSVKSHEPHGALYGGVEGLELVKRIIAESPRYLNKDGQLWIEHEPEQTGTIRKCAESAGFSVVACKDQYGVERYSKLCHFAESL